MQKRSRRQRALLAYAFGHIAIATAFSAVVFTRTVTSAGDEHLAYAIPAGAAERPVDVQVERWPHGEKDGVAIFDGVVVTGGIARGVEYVLQDGRRVGARAGLEDGTLAYEQPYLDGLRHGIQRIWVGGRRVEQPYLRGRRHGVQRTVAGDLILYEARWVDDRREGMEKQLYDDGRMKSEIPFVGDQMHGTARFYTLEGALEREVPYVRGRAHGTELWFVPVAGGLRFETPYVDGERHGTSRGYTAAGELTIEMPWEHGKQHGTRRELLSTGELYAEEPWCLGWRAGVRRERYRSGKVSAEIPYTSGCDRPNGLERRFFESGAVAAEVVWAAGVLAEARYFDEAGTPFEGVRRRDGRETPCRAGRPDGVEKVYHHEGWLLFEITWKDGRIEGLQRTYDETGKLVGEEMRHPPAAADDADGRPRENRSSLDGAATMHCVAPT